MDEDVPVGVTIERECRELRIDWPSGVPSVIPWLKLRLACPCALCQGEFRSQILDVDKVSETPDERELVDVVLMGHYAIQPIWKSGHVTGIYPWEYLRGL